MITRWTTLLVLACCALGLGCPAGGGGAGTGMMPGGIQAVFTPDNAAPGAMTVSMAAGGSTGASFDVVVNVTVIDDFFGAAFHVIFDSSRVSFDGFDATGTFIEEIGVTLDINAVIDVGDPNRLLVNATRRGQVAGVDAVGSQLLITLSFTATGPGVSGMTFDVAATRLVATCTLLDCTDLDDAVLTWSGGTLVSN